MKALVKGFTTGTCAAAASKAAAQMLAGGREVDKVTIELPSGMHVSFEVEKAEINTDSASCAVRKFSGDDPDVTDGLLIYSEVTAGGRGIRIDGGEGVGRITKPGLQRKVGEAAINNVPRKMIHDAVKSAFDEAGLECGADVLISVPKGAETAKKTFNPRLGIVGGISILGTTGIVEPMSTKALVDTIDVELRFLSANDRKYALITPGNYGRDHIRTSLGIDPDKAVKCSNFIGDAIDLSIKNGIKGITIVGHIGKLIKLAAGIMNTHSSNADARMEIICSAAAVCGAPQRAALEIMECITTDDAIRVLEQYGLRERVMERISDRINYYVNKRCSGMGYAFIVFSNVYGELFRGGDMKVLEETMKEASL